MKVSHRVFLTLLVVVLATSGIIGLWYAEEDYRGARAWNETRRKLEARGESLDAAHFIPPPVPDSQNLAMAPVFVRLFQYHVDPTTGLLTFGKNPHSDEYDAVAHMPFGSGLDGPPGPSTRKDWASGHPLDLAVYQHYYQSRKDFPHPSVPQSAADDILLALTRYHDVLDEVAAAAATRPLARFPVNWTQRPAWSIWVGHYNIIQTMSNALRLRACSLLALGQTDDALHDITLGLHLNDAISQEPTLISGLVALNSRSLLMQPIWEGLATRRWSAAQLGELQTRLGTVDTLRDLRQAEQFERASFMVSMREELRRPGGLRDILAANASVGEPGARGPYNWQDATGWVIPRGWADSSVAFACEWVQQYAVDAIDVTTHRLSPSRFAAGDGVLAKYRMTPTNFLIKLSGPIYTSVARKNVRAQAAVDTAVTACALERYYQDHQSYPASLDTLVPAYLPRVPTDVIDGAPLRYQLTHDGRYRLWEVGWDGEDDGGRGVWNQEGTRLDDKQGDWFWQYDPLSSHSNKES